MICNNELIPVLTDGAMSTCNWDACYQPTLRMACSLTCDLDFFPQCIWQESTCKYDSSRQSDSYRVLLYSQSFEPADTVNQNNSLYFLAKTSDFLLFHWKLTQTSMCRHLFVLMACAFLCCEKLHLGEMQPQLQYRLRPMAC